MKLNPRTLPFFPQLQGLFFLSGFSALVLEVVYVRFLRYWAGNTAYAVAAVLCAYMVGLALGSYAAGKWLLPVKHLVLLYGGLEVVVGLYSLVLPRLIELLAPAYLSVTLWLGADTGLAVFAHFAAAVALLLLPTLLMGATFPVVVRAASRGPADRPDLAEKLYTANLAGAATGALLSDFLLIRFWGLGNALAFVGAINTLLAVWAGALQSSQPAVKPERERVAGEQEQPRDQAARTAPLLVALTSGFLVLFQEIVWTNMVGRFLDNTVYGFAVTLFAVIAGLGLGAALVVRNRAKWPAIVQLSWVCLGAGLLVLGLGPFWDSARLVATRYPYLAIYVAIAVVGAAGIALKPEPKTLGYIFGAFPAVVITLLAYRWINPTSAAFWIRHGVVFCVSVLFTLAAAVLMGMVFPLALDWYLGTGGGASRSVAPVYAVNTAGSVAGILVATFVVLPRMGVEWGGRAVGLAFFAVGLVLTWRARGKKWLVLLAVAPVTAWSVLVAPWDLSKDHSAMGHPGKIVYAQEDLNGGVTTVLQNGSQRILYLNSLLQGGGGLIVGDQIRFALVPLLYNRGLERAMVIGVGSGQTAGVVGLFPFKHIDLVDFSPRVVEAASRVFTELNFGIFTDPRVKVHIADGRHYLLTHPEKVDLLTIEVTRLWVAGEGDLYTREFYELCSARLRDQGVLQQWVPLFDLSVRDTLIILRTVRAAFPYVTFYMGVESGMIVASRSPLAVEYANLQEIDATPARRGPLVTIGLPRSYYLLGDCVLTPEGVDALLAREHERRISTDLWPHLEYSNARFYVGNPSSRPLRLYLLGAQAFQLPPIRGADAATLDEIRKDALAERNRLFRAFPPH